MEYNSILIERVSPEQLIQLQQISIRTFEETFAEVNTAENMQLYLTQNLSSEKLAAELQDENSVFFFARMGHEIIGYLKLNFGAAQTELKDEKAVEIERIYVRREYLGKNIGRLLYGKALEVAAHKNAGYIWLGVWEENHRAIAFYTKNGFTAFGKHVFHLGNDAQTDILMKLPLKG